MPTSQLPVWWSLLAVFWLWFIVDCVKVSLRRRFWLSSFWGRRRASVNHGALAITAFSPLAWQTVTEDAPLSFSPDGLCNVAVGSAGRPIPRAERAVSYRWEDIREIKASRGQILINGEAFCAETPLSSALELNQLLGQMKTATADDRARDLARRLKAWFPRARLGREINRWRGVTASLAVLATFNFLVALIVSIYLVGNFARRVGQVWSDRLAQQLPALLLLFALVHLGLMISGFIAHRRLMPKKGEERLSHLMSAAFLPPQALRLRAQIAAAYFSKAHPLAWLSATLPARDFAVYAQQMLRDLNWPLPPSQPDNADLIRQITSWMRGRITLEADRLVQAAGLATETLFGAPQRDSEASCAYCPRCGTQFMTGPDHCPQHVKLLALK